MDKAVFSGPKPLRAAPPSSIFHSVCTPVLGRSQGLHVQPLFIWKEREMSQFYAMPYDLDAKGFYFEDEKTYLEKRKNLKNTYGDEVEEFEFQFIDGEIIDAELFKALSVNQSNILHFIKQHEQWNDEDKINLIIAVGECGYSFDFETSSPNDFDIDIYEIESLKELAYQFVDDGLFGEIPDNIACYLDYEAIARDLAVDYSEININGNNIIYRYA
jgi:antirestriction protein